MRRVVLVAGAASVLFSVAEAKELTLRDLEDAIRRSGVQWKAGPSRVSGLPQHTKVGMMGVSLTEEVETLDVPHSFPVEGVALPPKFDWRNVEGVNYTSPVLDQGQCGSCVSFAATATLQDQMNVTQKTPSSPWAFSPQHLFSCGGGSCDRGWRPGNAASFLRNNGIPDEACFPYQSGADGKDAACRQSCSDSKSRSVKIVSFSSSGWGGASEEAVKTALLHGPVVTTMQVYEDFTFYKSGVYKHVTGSVLGGHAISIVGWDDSENSWIVRNSWNTDWGEGGYFRIDRDDASRLGKDFWSYQVAENGEFVTLGALRDRDVISGQRELPFDVRSTGASEIEWTLRQKGKEVFRQPLGNTSVAVFDSTRFADGVYELQATARTNGKALASQPRIVYLLNGVLSGTIALKGLADGQKLKGTIEFTVLPETSPVPLTLVRYTVRNVQTGEMVRERSSTSVGPQMNFGWKTTSVKNGDYEITFEGLAGPKAAIKPTVIRVSVAN
jgi:C1A family cysteine protease